MPRSDLTRDLIPIAALLLGGYILYKSINPGIQPINPNNPCPYGQEYDRPLFGGCEPGYIDDFWSNRCKCTGGR